METVILCGGLGTRLREETEFRPKPMVNIGSRPILWHIMKIFAHHGHTDFVLPLGYKGEMIRDFFVNYEWMNNDITLELGKPDALCLHECHDETGWRITLADTGQATFKGGRIKRIEKYIEGDTFLLTYGDGVADVDINRLVEFHHTHGKIATITGVNPAQRFGEMKIDGTTVVSFREKPKEAGNNLINGGYMVLNRKIFDYLTPDEDCDFEYGPLERLAIDGELHVFQHNGFWACMDTLRDTEALNQIWNTGEAAWKVW
ncbi:MULTISPECIES: glucose-1-phosphate cytidylyltransferase [unclassified Pseudodesulfovibrio]|uniref:glucose-1-phosphate cytidylyltransferase n=1 Tax=unclassified Pseudodesulfovibrio TaxID=2661612 RepID=UPI000FEBCF88|nr:MULTISPECIES: glucose-1-phosphate cytidylyltransferase [unclassified Pseudodesulfovibrio]MCJ2163212.1 glucose-1-phosphate cytidylyltransferase [Pseudodesulfovibrio sp. S3-i]RWU07195.1 glucose-1-phosphate cytidylyltransferase [Pseudodesulfovibrio sp. S3]